MVGHSPHKTDFAVQFLVVWAVADSLTDLTDQISGGHPFYLSGLQGHNCVLSVIMIEWAMAHADWNGG